ncbi:MAG: YccF domain-containing protein [Clostridiaceae bacterium]|nr:YccF domain-containing protein [Clostridiaceae bacterium]
MYLLGNLIWIVFGGLLGAILWFVAGILCCITIYGIPFGIQCFKISALVFWPFGKKVDIGFFGFGGLLGNLIWILIVGWVLFLIHSVIGLIMCLTIIGIPFGRQHLKLAKLAILPFGAKIY